MYMRVMTSVGFAMVLVVTGAQAADHVVATGTFAGASGHVASGGVSVVRTDAGSMVVLEKDFRFDGGPDTKVGFGRDGVYDAKAQLAPLGANEGRQSYPIPDSVDPRDIQRGLYLVRAVQRTAGRGQVAVNRAGEFR